jgi:UDP-N-acetylglucosamine diphosphorylase / glucose-1-phosphate thymidylyltransferase / UDP-N-acetylgalactosamine diphosphorylase / glucosamine-1-phosphate N-acetyltransferase / galactosamine-1-phosphate N-acetyltransferase
MHICLFEDAGVDHLSPLSLTRHAGDLRLGMHSIAEMHQLVFGPESMSFSAREVVAAVTRQEHPGAAVNHLEPGRSVLLLNARYVPRPGGLVDRLKAVIGDDEARLFNQGDDIVAVWLPAGSRRNLPNETVSQESFESVESETVEGARMIGRLWDLVDDVGGCITRDFMMAGRRGTGGATIHDGVHIIGTDVMIEPGATVLPGTVVNALDGPVYIARDAVIEENVVLRGPVYVGPRTFIKACARVEATSVGYWCKVGGEVHGSVIHSLSAKAHDGYLGSSYLGRWCNLGADTNTSNLKNDYGNVTMFDAVEEDFIPTGKQFLGLMMGDHSKCSINSMFNTGTVIGVSCNLFGSGFPPRHVPSFSWGGAESLVEYRVEKALRVAEAVMARRDAQLTVADRETLEAIFQETAAQRAAAEVT